MKTCVKCEGHIPATIVIDGKRRNLKNRQYCFSCSPFGEHNNRQLHKVEEVKQCKCGREYVTKGQIRCASCNYKERRKQVAQKIYSIVGTACWICGYDRGEEGTGVLDFHHIDPNLKEFHVSNREIASMKWERVWREMQKCALLCCRCHREYHVGLTKPGEIEKIWQDKWFEIRRRNTTVSVAVS